jgi:EAL domain-containing protein (putative c-di-GMP-specific phosphodiesterase class I)
MESTIANKTDPANFNLKEILEGEWVEAHFQPLVSMKRQRIVGLEGLSRGISPGNRRLISPYDLFHQAALQDLEVELDLLCRKKIMEAFRTIHYQNPDYILSLNLDESVLKMGLVGSGHLRHEMAQMGLNPASVAIEIVEYRIEDLKELQRFVEILRGYGFLIALDDVGAGHSNLNRIPLIKPDILKIDRYLVTHLEDDFYKREIVKSLVRMGRRLGTVLIAEGVETAEEARVLMEMDVDMIQGFYFSRPQRPSDLDPASTLEKVKEVVRDHKARSLENVSIKRRNMSRFLSILLEIQAELASQPEEQFGPFLQKMLVRYPLVECFYVLDGAGLQVTESVLQPGQGEKRNHRLFHPSPLGTDHTAKDYCYYLLEAGMNKNSFLTEPYLSMTSGNNCVTLSSLFKNHQENPYILCLDIDTQTLRQPA